jgi:hypothetical protein
MALLIFRQAGELTYKLDAAMMDFNSRETREISIMNRFGRNKETAKTDNKNNSSSLILDENFDVTTTNGYG